MLAKRDSPLGVMYLFCSHRTSHPSVHKKKRRLDGGARRQSLARGSPGGGEARLSLSGGDRIGSGTLPEHHQAVCSAGNRWLSRLTQLLTAVIRSSADMPPKQSNHNLFKILDQWYAPPQPLQQQALQKELKAALESITTPPSLSKFSPGCCCGPCSVCGCPVVPDSQRITGGFPTGAGLSGTYDLPITAAACGWFGTPTLTCSTPFFISPTATVTLDCDGTNFSLVIDLSGGSCLPTGFPTPHCIATYKLAAGSWLCLGTNVMNYDSEVSCSGITWPATVTVEPTP